MALLYSPLSSLIGVAQKPASTSWSLSWALERSTCMIIRTMPLWHQSIWALIKRKEKCQSSLWLTSNSAQNPQLMALTNSICWVWMNSLAPKHIFTWCKSRSLHKSSLVREVAEGLTISATHSRKYSPWSICGETKTSWKSSRWPSTRADRERRRR